MSQNGSTATYLKIKEEFDDFRYDTLRKLNFPFIKGKKLLDIGCGNGRNSKIFRDIFELEVTSVDIYEHENVKKYALSFLKEGLPKLSFPDSTFDYVFLSDVLHHIDEEKQNFYNHKKALEEIKRVVKNSGYTIVIEGNRYNPLFYPHMVLLKKHNHFTQKYFVKLLTAVFADPIFKFFEVHSYPRAIKRIVPIYEYIMEHFLPKRFLAYNVCIAKVTKDIQ